MSFDVIPRIYDVEAESVDFFLEQETEETWQRLPVPRSGFRAAFKCDRHGALIGVAAVGAARWCEIEAGWFSEGEPEKYAHWREHTCLKLMFEDIIAAHVEAKEEMQP